METIWKTIERASLVVGLLIAAATLYFTAGLYYGWNNPQPNPGPILNPGAPASPGPTLNPNVSQTEMPLWLILLGVLGFALLVAAVAMMIVRHRQDTLLHPVKANTSLLRNILLPFGRIPLRRASQIAYEKNEQKLVGDVALRMGKTPDDALEYFFHSFCIQGIPIYGQRPPSSKSLRIPPDELRRLYPVHGTDNVAYASTRNIAAYENVFVFRRDLSKAIRHLRNLNNAEAS